MKRAAGWVLCLVGAVCAGQQLSREYIRMGGRVIAIESPGGLILPAAPPATACDDLAQKSLVITASAATLAWSAAVSAGSPLKLDGTTNFTGSGTIAYHWGSQNCSSPERAEVITLTQGAVTQSIAIRQLGGQGGTFTASPTSVTMSYCAAGNSAVTLTLGSPTETLSASANRTWITNTTVSPGPALARTLSFQVTENGSPLDRTGTIQIQNGAAQQTVTVVQSGKPELSLPAQPVTAAAAGGAVNIPIAATAGLTYSIELVDNTSGLFQALTQSQTQGTGPMTLTLTATALASGTRGARLQVKAVTPCGEITAEILITQSTGVPLVSFQLQNPNGALVTNDQLAATGGTGTVVVTNLNASTNVNLLVTKDPAATWLTITNPCQPLINGTSIQYTALDNPPTSEGQGPQRNTTLFFQAITNPCPGNPPAYAGNSLPFRVTQLGRTPSVIRYTVSPLLFENIPATNAASGNYRIGVNVLQQDANYPFVWWPQMNGFISGPSVSGASVYNPGPNNPNVVNGYVGSGSVGPTTIFSNPCDAARSTYAYVFYATADGNAGLEPVRYTQLGNATPTSVCFEPDALGVPVENGGARGVYVVRAHGASSFTEISTVSIEFRQLSNPASARMCKVTATKSSGTWDYRLQDDLTQGAGQGQTLGTAESISVAGCTLHKNGSGPLTSSSGRVLHFGFHVQLKPLFVPSAGTAPVNVPVSLTVGNGATGAAIDQGLSVAAGAPTAETVTQGPLTSAGQEFTFDFADRFGFDNISAAEIRFGDTSTPFCDLHFDKSTSSGTGFFTNRFGIMDFTTGSGPSNGWTELSAVPGPSLTNTRCTVSAASLLPTAIGLRLKFTVKAEAGYATGSRAVLARAKNFTPGFDSPGGWTQVGVWNLGGTGGGGGAGGQSVVLGGAARLTANVTDTGMFNNRQEWRIETRVHGTTSTPLVFQDGTWLFSANGHTRGHVYASGSDRLLLMESETGSHYCRYNVTGKQDLVLRAQRRAGSLPEFAVWEVSNGTLVSVPSILCGTAAVPATQHFAGSFVLGGSTWGGAANYLTGAIAYFRMYATPAAVGATPSAGVESGVTALLRYEFEDSTNVLKEEANQAYTLAILPIGQTVGTTATPGGTTGGGSGGGGGTPPATGQSVWLANQRLVANVPAVLPNNEMAMSRNDWRFEMRVHGDTPGNRPLNLAGDTRLLSLNGQVQGQISWSGQTQFLSVAVAGGGECRWVITGKQDILLRVQRRSGGAPEYGLWAVNGSTLDPVVSDWCQAGTPSSATNFSGPAFVIGGPSWGGGSYTMTGAVAYARLYETAATVGSNPALAADTSGLSMRWEFEGTGSALLQGESGGPAMTVDSGTVTTVPTPGTAASGTGALTAIDIGTVPEPGSTTFANNVYTMNTKSGLAFLTADSMHYAYQTMTGDFEAVVQVTGFTGGHETAKAGLMVRDPSGGPNAAGAKEVFVAVQRQPTQPNRCLSQWRDTANGATAFTPGVSASVLPWLRVVRQGNVFTLYCKPGVAQPANDWTTLGATTVSMSSQVLVGLGVAAENTAGSGTLLLTASFANLTNGTLAGAVAVAPPDSVLLSGTGASSSFNVSTTGGWTAAPMVQECPSGTACWVSLGTTSGTGSATVNYTVPSNPSWYGGRSGPVKVTSGGNSVYHTVRQKPYGPFTTVFAMSPGDVTAPVNTAQRLTIDLMNVPYTLTGVHLDIGLPGGSGPSSTRCYIAYDHTAPTYYMKWTGWVTTGSGVAGANTTIQVKDPANAQVVNCGLYLGDASVVETAPVTGQEPGTKNYRMAVTLTLGSNLPAGVRPVRVVTRLQYQANGTTVNEEREWEVGYWR